MSDLAAVRTFLVPRRVVLRGQEHLRAAGRRKLEGFVLWAGECLGDDFHVREAIIPEQSGYQTPAGVCVTVAGKALHQVNVYLFERGWTLGAQIHSHPREAFHSGTDDTYAISTLLGSLSIVVPDFAAHPFAVERCAMYRLFREGWKELSDQEAKRLVKEEA